ATTSPLNTPPSPVAFTERAMLFMSEPPMRGNPGRRLTDHSASAHNRRLGALFVEDPIQEESRAWTVVHFLKRAIAADPLPPATRTGIPAQARIVTGTV